MGDILFLAHRIPWPADRGDKIRSHNILRHLADMAPVHVACFADDTRDMGFVSEMEPKFATVYAEIRTKPQWQAGIEALVTGSSVSVKSFATPSMSAHVDAILAGENISHIFCFSGQMAQYVPTRFDGNFVMDFVDVDSAKFESYAGQGNPLMRWVNAREGRKLAEFEHDIARRADACLFVSDAEADLFRKRSGIADGRIQALGNGIDTVSYDPANAIPAISMKDGGPMIVFTGQMDYRPNIEAVTDFALNVLPDIHKQHPSAIFAIVGRNPPAQVQSLARKKGVIVTGAVGDVRSWLNAAAVVVAPLRIARGIQNKVLEAMAMAKPVMASACAAEGINAEDGIHFRIAADVQAEARIVCDLLADPLTAKTMGDNARRHVVSHYGWVRQLSGLRTIMAMDDALVAAAE